PSYHRLGRAASTQQIKLVEDRAARARLYVFELVPRDGGENVNGARGTGCARGHNLAARMQEAAVPHGSKQERQAKIKTQHPRTQRTIRKRDGVARAERDIFKCPAILAQRDLA